MADTPVPSPGYGNTSEVSLDTYNQWQRAQPWYQALLKSFGQDPNNVHLNDQQKQAVVRAAQAHGAVIDEGNNGQEVDDSGNLRGVGHKLRNTLIVAGIAAAALATAGAAGAFGGAVAGGGAGASGAASGAAAGLGGVESGAAAGLGALALPGAGTALGAGAGAAGALGTAAELGGAFDAAGNFIGDSSIPGATGSFASGGSGLRSILDTASQLSGPLSAIASGRAQGAQAEAGASQAQDRNAISLYGAENAANANENQFNLGRGNLALSTSTAANNFGLNRGSLANANAATDLAQRNFALTAPGKRASNAVRGDILSNARDVAFSGLPSNIPVPTISGGLRPSMFSADTRALGQDITSQARAAQAKGDTFAPLPDLPTYQAPEGGLPTYKAGPAAPQLTGLPSGGATTALGNTSSILALAPSFADVLRKYLPK